MEQITGYDILKATNGTLLGGDPSLPLSSLCIDSRKAQKGALFIPLLGEHSDGHDFIKKALEMGALGTLTSRREVSEPEKLFIYVPDTKEALQNIGRYCRNRLSIPIVGITGSVGKTTTREMVSAVLKTQYRIFSTTGNHNGQLGLPIMLSEITREHQAAVLEMGMSLPGEMEVLGKMARISIGIMTNIGLSHIENLGSQENICREKLHMTDGMDDDGILLINGDDPVLTKYAANTRWKTFRFGLSEDCHYRAKEIHTEGTRTVFTACTQTQETTVALKVPGLHNVSNAMAAIACGALMGIPLKEAARGLEQFSGFAHRLETETFHHMTLIDDAYNASPDSMRAALSVLSSMEGKGKKIAVLSDMLELGPDSETYHRQVGEFAKSLPIDEFVLTGTLARYIGEEIGPKARWFGTQKEALSYLLEAAHSGDIILWKGSNGMRLGDMMKRWKEMVCHDEN